MTHIQRLLMAAAIGAASLCAQTATCNSATIPVCAPGSPSGDVQTKPAAAPTSATVVTTSDAYLKSVTVTNTTGSAVTFTLTDRQGTPVAVISGVSIAANTTYVVTFPDKYWCPFGFTVQAGGSGLNFYVSWRQ